MTGLRPGTSPPPVRMAIFCFGGTRMCLLQQESSCLDDRDATYAPILSRPRKRRQGRSAKAASGDTQPYIFAQVWECGRLRELKKINGTNLVFKLSNCG